MRKTFLDPLLEDREFLAARDYLKTKKAPVQVSGCTSVQKSHFVSALAQEYPFRLIVTASELRAKEMAEDLSLYEKNVYLYPAKDVIANLKKDIVDYRNQLHEIATDPSLGVNSQKWKEVQKNVFVSLAT